MKQFQSKSISRKELFSVHQYMMVDTQGLLALVTCVFHKREDNLMSWKVASWKDGVAHHFVGNKSPDSHHGSTSLVQFDGALLQLGGFIQLVPSEVKGTVTVVADKFGFVIEPWGITVDNFGNSKEGKHLQKDVLAITTVQKCLPSSHTIRDVLGSWETDSGGSGQVTNNSKHGNTSVLEFTLAKGIELFLVSVFNELQRIPQSQRSSDTNFVFESGNRSGSAALLGRGKGGGRSDKSEERDNLHVDNFLG
mmetsp:Transcript_28212/g.68670  ORF Transcript_28212/g.68670 Transcript_28212/m.68670 type:complete len:251 (-) Transcript_28212:42-794(-)